jgi:His-Xaa-Ser system radical SAM maturase HxsC
MTKVIKLTERNLKPLTIDRIINTVFLKVTTNPHIPSVLRGKHVLILNETNIMDIPSGFGAYFSTCIIGGEFIGYDNSYQLSSDLSYLSEGDVVRITPGPNLRVVFRKKIPTNYITVTEQCDSFCIMCSQPPKKIDDSHLIKEYIAAIPLFDINAYEIGISGGEPTLLGSDFIKLLESINCYLPRTTIHVLTNGKSFSDRSFVEALSLTKHSDLMYGIPLYSSIPYVHDFIVQDSGAFNKTINGILNLKQYGQKVELRFVIQKENFNNLESFAEFVARNLQFVDQVAFMGLEATGFAKSNLDALWVEPQLYSASLERAVSILNQAKVRVKLFNFQLCTLPRSLWEHTVKSISDWKNCYIDECSDCSEKSNCGGFFSTSDGKIPKAVKAIK